MGEWVVAWGTEEEAQQQRAGEEVGEEKIRGEREEQALKRESSREASGGGYKEEEEEEGLKLKRVVVRINDLQINKTSRFPETLVAKQRGIQSIKNSMK